MAQSSLVHGLEYCGVYARVVTHIAVCDNAIAAAEQEFRMNPQTDMRAHVIMSREVVQKIDRLVGQRRRSKFINDAVTRELARLELLDAIDAAAGSGKGQQRPWGDTARSIADWVHNDRQASLDDEDTVDDVSTVTADAR